MRAISLILTASILSAALPAASAEYIVKFKNSHSMANFENQVDSKTEKLMDRMLLVNIPDEEATTQNLSLLRASSQVEYVEKNRRIALPPLNIDATQAAVAQLLNSKPKIFAIEDNLPIPAKPTTPDEGADPLQSNQWGMKDIQVTEAWRHARNLGSSKVIVAVIDTGVDYTHEDLVYNMWRNPGETPGNGIDDDNNGYIDDIVGWDFVSNDNLPFDLSVDPMQLIIGGGNPGHGTHCAGNVAARAGNAKGIVGVAPNVQIMALRFLSEKGQGSTAGAIKSIMYAVNNGAQILSNSWGSVGEDANDPNTKALKDAIQYAQDNNSLFVAAAGNGKKGVGYDNDTDSQPAYPASYKHDVIVSVAALDEQNQLGTFSNWGKNSVDIGAPGVKVFSTVPGNVYQDTVFDKFGITITWDGTSMATPHVAGAAALYLSEFPNANWKHIKTALLQSAKPIDALKGKAVSEGKLNVLNLMKQ